ncbi:hypothetical protein ES703_114978 [subsurface metagenome]
MVGTDRNGAAKVVAGCTIRGSQLLLSPVSIVIFEDICSTGVAIIFGCADDDIVGIDRNGKAEPVACAAIRGRNFERIGVAAVQPLVCKDAVIFEIHIIIPIEVAEDVSIVYNDRPRRARDII